MAPRSLMLAAALLAARGAATDCEFVQGLSIPQQFRSAVESFCSHALQNPGSANSNDAPAPLSDFVARTPRAELGAVCSCLAADSYPTKYPTYPTYPTHGYPTCESKTVTTTKTKCRATTTTTDTITHSKTITLHGSTVTVTLPASTSTVTLPPSTSTVTIPPSTSTVTLPPSTSTVTLPPSTSTITLPPSTSTITLPPSTSTITLPPSTSTVTLPQSTVTATVTSIPPEPVDQSGCPAVEGDSSFQYVIYCNQGAGPGSFAASTNPGYNFEDCASQCFDNPDGIDCLGVTYTPPANPFSIFDGHLTPGTCTFYEFVTEAVAQNGVVLGVFENTFA